jgi:hypothetical protein
MEESLIKYLNEFIEKRAEDIYYEIIAEDVKYKELKGNLTDIQKLILNAIDDNVKKIFMEYENIVNTEICFIREKVYIEGLEDGIKIADTIKKIKSETNHLVVTN